MNRNSLAVYQTGNTASPWVSFCAAAMLASTSALPVHGSEFSAVTVCSESPVAVVSSSPRFKTKLSDDEADVLFHALLMDWKKDTAVESVVSRVVRHPAFRRMAAMGPQAVPMILNELQKSKDTVWLSALADITGEWPVAKDHETDGRLMVADWLAWGKANGAL